MPPLASVPCSDDWTHNDLHLFPYQVLGVNWLAHNFHIDRSVILADEMGLGKTVQVSVFLDYVRKVGVMQPFLVIAPLSTMMHWKREFERFTSYNFIYFYFYLLQNYTLLFIMVLWKIEK